MSNINKVNAVVKIVKESYTKKNIQLATLAFTIVGALTVFSASFSEVDAPTVYDIQDV